MVELRRPNDRNQWRANLGRKTTCIFSLFFSGESDKAYLRALTSSLFEIFAR